MVKQKLEKLCRESIKNCGLKIWYEKLHNNPLSHQTTTGDFLVIFQSKVIIIECKQVSVLTSNKRFVLNRLTQLPKLLLFNDSSDISYSFLLLSFQDRSKINSDYYFIPIKAYLKLTKDWKKQSINRNDAKILFEKYEIFIKNNNLEIWTENFNKRFLL